MKIFPLFVLYHIDNHCVNSINSFVFYSVEDTIIANSLPYSNNVLYRYNCKNIGNSIVNDAVNNFMTTFNYNKSSDAQEGFRCFYCN